MYVAVRHSSYIYIASYFSCYYRNRTDDRLPDIMWCRDPFMETLNEIEGINY